MVFSLVQKCVDVLVKKENLFVENALAFYFLSDRTHAAENKKSFGLSKMLQDLPLSLESGREVLAQMSEGDIETMLLFEAFAPLHRWRILIAWCRARQHTEGDLALESDLPEDFQIEVARKMIEPLLPVVELFKISPANSCLMEPFQALLSEPMQRMLIFHLKGTAHSGGNRWKATHARLIDSVKHYLPVPLNSFVTSNPVLLFHGEPGTCTDDSLRKTRDGIPNTLTLIKLKNGSIFGGFSPEAWMSQHAARACPDSFVFLVAPSGPFLRLPFQNNNGILGGTYSESTHGSNFELYVNEHVLIGRMGRQIFSGRERERCAFIKEVYENGHAEGAIEYYQVYHLQ
ncbi:hypothetical protein BJ741DRAFT_618630 [Chytriomyces cf. hyalinus JEL632]|nr:hypothetical protein BJ741DRAFT_618630 [Chytriomyces cf. hyalinus JEL632]